MIYWYGNKNLGGNKIDQYSYFDIDPLVNLIVLKVQSKLYRYLKKFLLKIDNNRVLL